MTARCQLVLVWISLSVRAFSASAEQSHWSYLPLQSLSVPTVRDSRWGQTPVDAFVLAALEAKNLAPSGLASGEKLVRRIYFDLVGLPPTPRQVENFVQAFGRNSHAAVESLVDELLASPQYGERWARHWLDVARYADSNGQESDDDRPTAYHYRDFVIRAFNNDLPANTFLRWQLAGDEFEPDNPEAIAATGFIVAGTHIILEVPMEEEKIRTHYNELDDMISTTGSAMLGLTLACARCHDHKYDAIPTRDYYRILCAFNSGDRAEAPLAPLAKAKAQREAERQWKTEFDAVKKQRDDFLKGIRKEHESAAFGTKVEALKISDEEKRVLREERQTDKGKELAKNFSKELKREDKDYREFVSDEEKAEWEKLDTKLKTTESRKPKALPTALAFADYSSEPRPNWLLGRGDFRVKKEPLELGFLSVLTREKSASDFWSAARAESRRNDSTGQRWALAEWMTDLENGAGPLVARVMVNRVWQHHFGEGLVRTVSDFGVRGEPPTHPELLEWLTSEFVKSGWKVKRLQRLIMTSSVYLQDSGVDPAKAKVDPENRLLWRQNPRRIESEILRDSILAVSGTLNGEMYGPAFKPPIAPEALQARNVTNPYPKDAQDTPATRRRTIYMFHKRVAQYPLMQVFDGPDAQASCGRRENTTVAPQALALLNDKFVRARAEDFARRLLREGGDQIEAQVRLAWRLALGRNPTEKELASSVDFIHAQGKGADDSGTLTLANFCQAIFAFNEFVYVD